MVSAWLVHKPPPSPRPPEPATFEEMVLFWISEGLEVVPAGALLHTHKYRPPPCCIPPPKALLPLTVELLSVKLIAPFRAMPPPASNAWLFWMVLPVIVTCAAVVTGAVLNSAMAPPS